MNSKEIITAAARRQKTPRVPVSLLSGGAWTFNRQGLSLEKTLNCGAELAAEILAETNQEVGCDVVWPASGYHNLAIKALGGNIKWRKKGTPDVLEPLINEAREVEAIDLATMQEDKDLNTLWDTARVLVKNIGDHTMVGASQWGPFTLAGLIYGVERLMRNIYKDKESVHRVLSFTSELCYQYLASFIEAGVGILSVADPNSSGDLISRQQFAEFSVPYLQQVVSKIKARGVIPFIHICGNITNRLDLIPATGVEILSLDYKVPLAKAGEILGSQIAFAGNMNPVAVMQNAKAEEVARICTECIKAAGNSSYILMPGCDIPPAVPIENIKAMVNTARSYQLEV
ncbi:MAG: uroporphyrinogen decarboxylase family protein [Syntrophomonadaceae bacterium]|nr:uroporphyrinogen decarboxylase family protein [Syntrophomonadaceae bacterium]